MPKTRKPRKGKRAAAALMTSLMATPNPCPAGERVQFTGTGYDPAQGTVMLEINKAYSSCLIQSDRTIGFRWPYFNVSGRFYCRTYYRAPGEGSITTLAEVTVVVE